jgi:hypothetical protein
MLAAEPALSPNRLTLSAACNSQLKTCHSAPRVEAAYASIQVLEQHIGEGLATDWALG